MQHALQNMVDKHMHMQNFYLLLILFIYTRWHCHLRPSCANHRTVFGDFLSLYVSLVYPMSALCLFIVCLFPDCCPSVCPFSCLSFPYAVRWLSISSLFVCQTTFSDICLFPLCFLPGCCLLSVYTLPAIRFLSKLYRLSVCSLLYVSVTKTKISFPPSFFKSCN